MKKLLGKILLCCLAGVLLFSGIFATVFVVRDYYDEKSSSAELVVREEFEKQIEELKADSLVVKAELEEAKANLETSKSNLDEAKETISSLEKEKLSLESEISEKNENLQSLYQQNQELQELIDSMSGELDKVDELRELIVQNNLRIDELKNSVNELETMIVSISSNLQSLSDDVVRLSQQISKLGIDIDNGTLNLENIDSRISILETQISSMKKGVIKDMFVDSFVPTAYSTYSRSWVLFRNNLLIQWGMGRVSSKGVFKVYLDRLGTGTIEGAGSSFNPAYNQSYESSNYTILMTPKATGKDTTTVWACRVDIVSEDYFDGYITNRTSSGNNFSDGAFYYWFSIGIAADKSVSV